ncbi:hypothetical protein [Candidatus Bodocaedibacter vickermanii]|uniref:Uncharacterized protein n=1 Tax=Candidatus Bodocaedibacter vickermanii TaxID=2741701 RepID=A0A7L9RTB0_9PROT|nr:hypothetical protein CPBP_00624 [Candidatus Paracaedibacteraceae bacterium 'Lake Konstanz']
MKKILAAIVEYKLNKNDLNTLVQKIITGLNDTDNQYPNTFKNKMYELTREIKDICLQDTPSSQDEDCVMDLLKEMESLIVDYLSQPTNNQTNDCILH